MVYLKKFKLFENFDLDKNMRSSYAKNAAVKLGEKSKDEMGNFQIFLDNILRAGVSKVDLTGYVSQYVLGAPIVHKVPPKRELKEFSPHKNMLSRFGKQLGERIVIILSNKYDDNILEAFQNCLDDIIYHESGMQINSIIAYSNEYINNSSIISGFVPFNRPKTIKKDLSDEEYMDLIDYRSSIG